VFMVNLLWSGRVVIGTARYEELPWKLLKKYCPFQMLRTPGSFRQQKSWMGPYPISRKTGGPAVGTAPARDLPG
jgi:hypothetical protein